MIPTAPDYPTVICPGCGAEITDYDGFGVLYHEACGYCTHASISGVDGRMVCDLCGRDDGPMPDKRGRER